MERHGIMCLGPINHLEKVEGRKEKQPASIEAGCFVFLRLQIQIRAQFAVELVAASGQSRFHGSRWDA